MGGRKRRGGKKSIPSVYQPGHKAQTAQRDVDERVGGADAALDPHCDGGEEDGEEGEADVGGAHVGGSWVLGFGGGLIGVAGCVCVCVCVGSTWCREGRR